MTVAFLALAHEAGDAPFELLLLLAVPVLICLAMSYR
jgi:hypothetical protein